MNQYPSQILTLIGHLKKLPGVGRKTAERFAFYLLDWKEEDLQKFSKDLSSLKEKVVPCPTCGCLNDAPACYFCTSPSRDRSVLCLVSSPRDVYPIEETHAFKGLYHVIGGLLSPLDGRSIDPLSIEKLAKRITENEVSEVIIAFDSTLEGDATALFIKQELDQIGVKATRLAFGLPMGSSLDFVDYGTLEKAFTGRNIF